MQLFHTLTLTDNSAGFFVAPKQILLTETNGFDRYGNPVELINGSLKIEGRNGNAKWQLIETIDLSKKSNINFENKFTEIRGTINNLTDAFCVVIQFYKA